MASLNTTFDTALCSLGNPGDSDKENATSRANKTRPEGAMEVEYEGSRCSDASMLDLNREEYSFGDYNKASGSYQSDGCLSQPSTPKIEVTECKSTLSSGRSQNSSSHLRKHRTFIPRSSGVAGAGLRTPTANVKAQFAQNMSTPHDYGNDPFMMIDEDELEREADKVLAALALAKEHNRRSEAEQISITASSDSMLHFGSSSSYEGIITPKKNLTQTIESSSPNAAVARSCNISSVNTTQTLHSNNSHIQSANSSLNSTQTLHQNLNGTHTLEVNLNGTQTLESRNLNSTQTLDGGNLNNTQTLATNLNNTQTLVSPNETQSLASRNLNGSQTMGHNNLSSTQTLDGDQLNSTQTLTTNLNTTQTLGSPNSNETLASQNLNGTRTLENEDIARAQTVGSNLNCMWNRSADINDTQSIEDPNLNSTQTLQRTDLNGTQTLEIEKSSELNSTQTLSIDQNSTQTVLSDMNATQTPEVVQDTTTANPNSTQPSTSSLSRSQAFDALSEEAQTGPEEACAGTEATGDPGGVIKDVMKMSIDETCCSNVENATNMAMSLGSVSPTEEMSADTLSELPDQRPPAGQMQVDEPDTAIRPIQRGSSVSGTGTKPKTATTHTKSGIPDRRRTLPASISKVRPGKARESLIPPPTNKPKPKEKVAEAPSKVIQKTKPKSKWSEITKQIEKNAKTPAKPAARNVPSKLLVPVFKTPLERTTSTSSETSQSSQCLSTSRGADSGKKPSLKRQSLLPPSAPAQKPEFKKPRASLLPPPVSRNSAAASASTLPSNTRNKQRVPSKGLPKLASSVKPAEATEVTSQRDGRAPPDVVSSNTVTHTKSKPSPKSTLKTFPKADKSAGNKNAAASPDAAVAQLQSRLEEALRCAGERELYVSGLKRELLAACTGVEGLGVVTQHLATVIEQQQQNLVKSKEVSDLLTQSHHEDLLNHQHEAELLTQNHEQEKQAVTARLAHLHGLEVSRLKSEHAQSIQRQEEELTSKHQEERATITSTLTKEIEQLKRDCESWKVKYDNATDALHKDIDHRLQVALQPYANLPQEIQSLKTVVELKSCEIRDLRVENNIHKQKVEIIPDIKKKLYDTEQRLENVQALLDIVSAKEKETAEKYHKITRKAVQEKKENHRLSLNVEALELKLEEAEFTNSICMDPLATGELDVSTVSLPPYGIDNPDTSPSQFTRSFSRSSTKRRSQRKSNTSALEIPEDERQISPAKHLVFRSHSSSPSPTRVSSPRKAYGVSSPVTSPSYKASTFPRSYRNSTGDVV